MDDFGEFTSFGEFTDSGNAGITSGPTKETPVAALGLNSDLFAFDSFQGVPGASVGNGTQGFPDFSQFGVSGDVHMAGGVPFEIPPLPVSPNGDNFHVAGGVPFEIPPLPPDLSFDGMDDPEVILGLPVGKDDLTVPALSTPASTSQDSRVQLEAGISQSVSSPQASGNDFQSSVSGSNTVENAGLALWSADFSTGFPDTGNVPPISAQSSQEGESHIGNTDVNITGQNNTPALKIGDISSSSGNEADLEFGVFSAATATEINTSSESKEFGDFVGETGHSATSTVPSVGDKMGGLEIPPLPTTGELPMADSTSTVTTTSAKGGANFGEFGGFSSNVVTTTVAAGGDDFGEFGGFSSNVVTTTVAAGGDDFGEFGGLSSNVVTTTVAAGGNDFGEFGGLSSNVVTTTVAAGGDDFGGFSSNTATTTTATTDFGGFTSNTVATTGGDDFGEFGGFSEPTTTAATGGNDFGEFGGFSSATSAGFADFSSAKPQYVTPSTKSATVSPLPVVTGKKLVKSATTILGVCFAEVPPHHHPPPSSSPSTLTRHLKIGIVENKGGKAKDNLSLWVVLQNCIDLTVPLHKFDKSFLQNCYYSSLSVDPMLISRPSTLAVLTGMTKFEAPLGGATAMEDLRESFGFEGDMAQPGSPTEEVTSPFRKLGEHSAALLDLSLPLSPNSPTRDSFTLTADLAGLDLNPQPKQDKKLTSIQELLLNERLVVNRSTWIPSELAELGGGGDNHTQGEGHKDAASTNSQPNTPRSGKKAQSMEFQLEQLGLDVSKTTLPKGSSTELSLMARSVLGRLPDLSFMKHVDRLEKTTHYFRANS